MTKDELRREIIESWLSIADLRDLIDSCQEAITSQQITDWNNRSGIEVSWGHGTFDGEQSGKLLQIDWEAVEGEIHMKSGAIRMVPMALLRWPSRVASLIPFTSGSMI